MGLREILRLEVVEGRWKEVRRFVEVENPENRPISKIKKEDKDLVPLSPSDLTDAKTWYDSSTEANKKHILTDAGISEDVSKIPDSQELPKELQDKVGEDYDYLTDSEKISRLRAFGVEVRRKFPADVRTSEGRYALSSKRLPLRYTNPSRMDTLSPVTAMTRFM